MLAYLNARAYFSGTADHLSSLQESDSAARPPQDRKVLLLQAISLINLIEKRDDLIQLFQSLQVFL